MMDKYTKGPWKVVENGGRMVGVMSGGDWITYKAGQDRMTTDELEANALLISAAPDLLEACEALKREIILSDVDMAYIDSHFKPWLDKATAAIAKAKGSF